MSLRIWRRQVRFYGLLADYMGARYSGMPEDREARVARMLLAQFPMVKLPLVVRHQACRGRITVSGVRRAAKAMLQYAADTIGEAMLTIPPAQYRGEPRRHARSAR